MSRFEHVHDGLVLKLRDELHLTHDYDDMWLFMEYCRNGEVGEVDLLAMADDIYDFYEIKCNYHKKAAKKAHEQYERFCRAFPEENINGFIYTGNRGLMRL